MTSFPLLTSSSSSSFYSLSCSCSCFRIRNDRQPFSCLMLDDASRLPTSHGHIRASLIVHKYIHILNLVNSKPPVTECIIILKILSFLFIQLSFRLLYIALKWRWDFCTETSGICWFRHTSGPQRVPVQGLRPAYWLRLHCHSLTLSLRVRVVQGASSLRPTAHVDQAIRS